MSHRDAYNLLSLVFTNRIPFLVIGLSWGNLGEPIHGYHAVGASVVIAGVVLTARR